MVGNFDCRSYVYYAVINVVPPVELISVTATQRRCQEFKDGTRKGFGEQGSLD